MRIERHGHSSIAIETDEVLCLMDPVFVEPIAGTIAVFDPPIRIDTALARASCNLIVLSHHHPDHFCVRSLDLLDRDAVVIYPKGAMLISSALARLGFAKAQAVEPGAHFDIGDLHLYTTPSRVSFPEMGVFFESRQRTCWNLVDTVIDDHVLSGILKTVGRPDVLLAPYQPLDQLLHLDTLGHAFPFELYGNMLRTVFDVHPRAVVPSACGVRYVGPGWLTDRGFPTSPEQFLADIARVDPTIERILLPPGGTIELKKKRKIDLRGSRLVTRLGDSLTPSHDWRPDHPIPALADANPIGYAKKEIVDGVKRFLDEELFARLEAVTGPVWRERMRRFEVIWRLEVVYPDGTKEVRTADLGARTLRWSSPARSRFVKLHSSYAASALVGFLRGDIHPDRFYLGDARVFSKLYAPHRGGVESTSEPDPMYRVLYPGSQERFIERELAALGY